MARANDGEGGMIGAVIGAIFGAGMVAYGFSKPPNGLTSFVVGVLTGLCFACVGFVMHGLIRIVL